MHAKTIIGIMIISYHSSLTKFITNFVDSGSVSSSATPGFAELIGGVLSAGIIFFTAILLLIIIVLILRRKSQQQRDSDKGELNWILGFVRNLCH